MGFLKNLRKPKQPTPSPAEVALASADAFVAVASVAVGEAALDYSQVSVFKLDALFGTRWYRTLDNETYKSIPELMGGYIGEVMVRHLGGRWTWGLGTPIVTFREGDIDPVFWVRKRRGGDEPQYIAMAYTALRLRLGKGPDDVAGR